MSAAAEEPDRPLARWRRPAALDIFAGIAIALLALLAIVVVAPGIFSAKNPTALDIAARLSGPSSLHPLGTDELGRDILARVAYGARNSVGVSLLIVAIAVAVGLVWGTIAGWIGGILDAAMMRVVDMFLAFPAFVLAMALAAALGPSLGSVVVALAAVWWPGYARLVRGAVMSLKSSGHVVAARAQGLPTPRIIWRHVLRFVWRDINVRSTADIGYALMAVTALSFLGLGAQSPTPEWGLLIRSSAAYFYTAWWYMAFPGLAVTLTAVSLSILGDWIAARPAK
jgi:peptide/nickel transport system permease protein